MSAFRDRLRRAVENGATPEDAYDSAVKGVRKDQLADHFRAVGVDEARHLRRQASRRVENHVFGDRGRSFTREEQPRREVDVRALLARSTWSRRDGTVVSWLTATRQDHRDRIAHQEELIGHLQDDVDRHRHVLKVLEQADVETLNELSPEQIAEVTR